MLQIPRSIGCGLLMSCLIVQSLSSAELRTTSGKRTIYRTASFSEAVGGPHEVLPEATAEFIIDAPCDSCSAPYCDGGCIVPGGRWANFEYLLWWRRGRNFPALATTSPFGTAQDVAGELGESTTQILFGNETVGEEARPGGRLTIGTWLDACQNHGVEGRLFMLGNSRINFAAASDATGLPILARPSNSVANPDDQAILLAFDDPVNDPLSGPGDIGITSQSEVLGGDVLYRWLACYKMAARFDFLAGYQVSRIDEDLGIRSFSTAQNVAGVTNGTTFTTLESFQTRNEFHAGQIGFTALYTNCAWQLDLLAKIGLGNMRQVVTIAGETTIVTPPPGSTTSTQPGPLAGAANSGRHTRNDFAVAPELGINLNYSINECVGLSAGYSFIYWSSVVQPGAQIDPLLQDPPPAFVFNSGSYWVHGFNIGAHCRF
jgi:hypothetical protein